MVYKQIYLEPDEEITSVIDKISSTDSNEVVLVTAKNSGIFQSLVNLKLLSKESKKLKKNIAIVTTSKVGQRLAKQVGIITFSSVGSLPAATETAPSPTPKTEPAAPDEVINGVQVKQYDPNRADEEIVKEDEKLEEELASDDKVSETSLASEEKQEFQPVTVSPENLEKPEEPKKEEKKDREDKEELPAVVSNSRGFSMSKEFKIPWKSVGIGSGIFLFLILLAFVFVPRAVVTVTFPALPITETVSVSAVVDLENQEEGLISGNQLLSEKTKTEAITATGEKDIGTKAKGQITITNKYVDGSGSGKDQTFSAGTKATATTSKKVFVLDTAVTVGKVTYNPNNGQPIYKSETVNVTAIEPGDGYNIAADSFSLAGELSNTLVSSSSAFSGGLAKKVRVLTQDDVDTVILKIKKEAKEEALTELTEKAAGQKILSDGVWEVIKQEGADKEVGAQTETAVATVIIEYGAVVFDEAAATSIFTTVFDNKINENEQIVFPEEDKPAFITKKISDDKRRVDFDISGTAFKVPKIDKGQIAKSVTYESSEEAQRILQEKYGAEKVESVISPEWWINKLPFIKQAIRVEYGFNDTQTTKEEVTEEEGAE